MNSINNAISELKGYLSVQLANDQSLDEFCTEHINDYNRDRFEAFAVRILAGEETIVTIYAVDKVRQEDSTVKEGKIPVKKFKLTDVDLGSLISYCGAFNCTISTGAYDIEDMDVVNK